MQRFIVLLLSILITNLVQAQKCGGFLLLQNNKRIEMTVYNKKGKEDGKQVWQVSNVKTSGGTTTANVNSEFFDKKGKSVAKSASDIKCTGGALLMSLKMMLNEQQQTQIKNATATGDLIDYPANMKTGDNLKDGNMAIAYDQSGMEAKLEIAVTNRIVGDKETVTSPAGTWECFKITSNQKITSRIAGIGIPIKMEVTEWFAPGVGVIKTSSKFGSTLITSIQ